MERIPINDLGRISPEVRSAVLNDVADILQSGHFLKGKFTSELERQLTAEVGNRPFVCVGNGTDALYLALSALGLRDGCVVATVANAGGYSTGAILRIGGLPRFVDIDQQTAQMSPLALRKCLEESGPIDAVIVTHLYGFVGEIEELTRICHDFSIPLIEDCAQAFGAAVNGRPAGSFGDLSTFSFYPTKNLGAFGDAGGVCARDEEVKERVVRLAQYGWADRYSIVDLGGINSRIDEIQAATLLRLLPDVHRANQRRREIALRYQACLENDRRMFVDSGSRFVGHLAVLCSPNRESDRKRLLDAKVDTGIHYPTADHLQMPWTTFANHADLPLTDLVQKQILTLPCFPQMREEEVERVCSALRNLS